MAKVLTTMFSKRTPFITNERESDLEENEEEKLPVQPQKDNIVLKIAIKEQVITLQTINFMLL